MKTLYQAIGAVEQIDKQENHVDFKMTAGDMRIESPVAGIFRCCAEKNGQDTAENPYALLEKTTPGLSISVSETEETYSIETEGYRAVIQKSNGALSYFDENGNCVNQDDSLGIGWQGDQVVCHKHLIDGERFIGLGEKTGNLDRRGNAYVNWNTDYFAYPADGDPLYCSIPFYIGIHEKGCYGIFFNNSYRTTFNFGASNHRFASFTAAGGPMDYFLIYGENPMEIVSRYTELTGRMPMPPRWSLGFQQCRYSYYPDTEVLRIAQTFREKDIPADVMYYDIHYMKDYKVFTWDEDRFPNPVSLNNQLNELGFRTVAIVDPGIKVEKGYPPYDTGISEDVFAKYPDQEPYSASVWPGVCHFPDFTNPTTRNWWEGQVPQLLDSGIDGIWNDMNEPASWGQCTPDIVEFEFEGKRTSHMEARNVYGMQMARSSYEGLKKASKERPFVLTRAGFSGIQRYAAVWTGDNISSDEHMLAGVRLVNSLGVSGVSFAGYDVGGFAGTTEPNLFARWISIAAFSPFFRCHKMINSASSEPWSYGEEVTEIARNYVKLRYRLMPYLYAQFYLSAYHGWPLCRTLAAEHPHDSNIYDTAFQNQYMFGDALLICPVASTQEISEVYLPEGTWYDFYSDSKIEKAGKLLTHSPVNRLPVFAKAGAIISTCASADSTSQQVDTCLNLHVYVGQDGKSVIYDDDGISHDYQDHVSAYREVSWNENERTIHLSEQKGTYASRFTECKIYVHGADVVSANDSQGNNLEVKQEPFRWLEPISNFDPFYDQSQNEGVDLLQLSTIQFSLAKDELQIKLESP